MNYLGDFPTGATVYVPFHTFNAAGASVTITGLAVTDIEIYKDGGTTQRSSDAGYTLLDTDGIDFDGITGIHGFKVDLSDNTDAGFYAAGHDYTIVVSSITVDSQTVSFVAATFSIQNRYVGGVALDAAGVRSAVGLASANLDTQLSTIDDFLDTEVAAIKAKTDNLPASPAAVGSAMTLASGAITAAVVATDAIDADALAANAVDEILDEVVEGTLTMRQVLRLAIAFFSGKASGGGSTPVVFRDSTDAKNRISMTVDADGNRSAVTTDVS